MRYRNKLLQCVISLLFILSVLCTDGYGIAMSAYALNQESIEIPHIYITTADGNGKDLVKADDYVLANFEIIDSASQTETYDGRIKVRGHTTAKGEKKPYTIQFSKKVDLLGMGKAKKWCLLANCFDPTLLRNYLAFQTAKHMELAYTSDMQFVEIWMDGSYEGCYLLIEPVEIHENRVAINKTENGECGDFLIEIESKRKEAEKNYIQIDELRYSVKEPKQPTAEQMQYMTDILAQIITTVKDSEDFQAVQTILDVDSFAKFYLITELYKNPDIGYSSACFYYKDNRLYAGPIWDYDLTLGNQDPTYSENYVNASNPEGIYANRQLFLYLLQYPEFIARIRKYALQYDDFFENLGTDGGYLDLLYQEYASLFQRNFERWDVAKKYCIYMRTPDETYDENFDMLKNWIGMRKDWFYEYYRCYENLSGDVNADGYVTIADAVSLMRIIGEAPIQGQDIPPLDRMDFKQDNRLDVQDVLVLMMSLSQEASDG